MTASEPQGKSYVAEYTLLDRDIGKDLSLAESARVQISGGLGQTMMQEIAEHDCAYMVQVFRSHLRLPPGSPDPGTQFAIRADVTPILEVTKSVDGRCEDEDCDLETCCGDCR